MSRPNSKQTLIEAAYRLFLSRGYPATTVDAICKEASVSKGSFYHFFDSKETCGLEVLEYYYKQLINHLTHGPHVEIDDPVERMYVFLDHIHQQAERLWSRGCLMGSIAMDLGEADSAISRRNSDLFEDMTRRLGLLLAPALRRSGHRDRGATAQLAGHLLMLIEGSVVLSKAHGDWQYVRRGIDGFRRYLDCLIGR